METIDGISQKISAALAKAMPAMSDQEKYTAQSVCVLALYHARTAIAEKTDHLRARQCIYALSPFRTFAKRYAPGQELELFKSAHISAQLLRKCGIDTSPYMDSIVSRLSSRLDDDYLKSAEIWLDERVRELPSYGTRDEELGWLMVYYMIQGENYIGASMEAQARAVLTSKINDFIENHRTARRQGGDTIGKAFIDGSGLVITPESARVSFGSGNGSVSLVGGRLSVILPSK